MPPKVGVLCYNLCDPTVLLLNRIARRASFILTAYPLVREPTRTVPAEFAISNQKAARKHVTVPGAAREVMLLDPAMALVRQAARDSDVLISLGYQALASIVAIGFAFLHRKPLGLAAQFLDADRESKRPLIIRAVKRLTLRYIKHVLVQTPPTARTLREYYRADPVTLIRAPFSGGTERFALSVETLRIRRQQVRSALRIESNEKLVLSVGSLHHLKGFDVLIEAISRIERPRVRLVLVGPTHSSCPAYAQRLSARVAELKLGDKVQFAGMQFGDDLAQLYIAADVFALATRKDTWPKVVLEALACGLPIVTTDKCGSAGHLIRHGENGFVVPDNNPVQLAAALERILTEPALEDEMRAHSKRLAAACIDPDLEAGRFIEFIDVLMNHRPR